MKNNDIDFSRLNVGRTLSRLIIERDNMAHLFRYAYICRQLKSPKIILDIGCGDKSLAAMIYTGKMRSKVIQYHGVDLKDVPSDILKDKLPFPMFFHKINISEELPYVNPHIITCFEVIEHNTRENGIKLLDNISAVMNYQTELYLSTPCLDENKGKQRFHVYEYTYDELKEELEKRFEIIDHFGTFMHTGIGPNKAHIDDLCDDHKFAKIKEYYGGAIFSNIMAVFQPERAKNCIWRLKKK